MGRAVTIYDYLKGIRPSNNNASKRLNTKISNRASIWYLVQKRTQLLYRSKSNRLY